MGKIIERINGARIITAVFFDEKHWDGGLGWVDFVDDRWGKPRHRFAYIDAKDWEREIIIPDNGNLEAYGGKKATESQFATIRNFLDQALMNDNKIDIVVERRQVTTKKQFDFIVKVDDVAAFQG